MHIKTNVCPKLRIHVDDGDEIFELNVKAIFAYKSCYRLLYI